MFARQLQEEMDRELAQTINSRPSPAQHFNLRRRPHNNPIESDLNRGFVLPNDVTIRENQADLLAQTANLPRILEQTANLLRVSTTSNLPRINASRLAGAAPRLRDSANDGLPNTVS